MIVSQKNYTKKKGNKMKTFNHGTFADLFAERKEIVDILTNLIADYKFDGDVNAKIPYNYPSFNKLEAEVSELKDLLLKSTAKEVAKEKVVKAVEPKKATVKKKVTKKSTKSKK